MTNLFDGPQCDDHDVNVLLRNRYLNIKRRCHIEPLTRLGIV